MYRVRDLISKRAISIAPETTVEAAMDLLRLHQIDLLPVVADASAERRELVIIGIVDGLTLYRYHGELPVREVMLPPVTIEIDAPLGEAAALMLAHRIRQLPVVEEGRFVGLLHHADILDTWGTSRDARTALPWQDHMRRWASTHLSAGREIAVLFLDLNDFGHINKRHGHVAGDRALKALADAMKACVDPRHDLLCRYGGDEFAVATTRSQEEAWLLAQQIREEIGRIPWKPDDPVVGVSIGIAGGKRRGPRPGDHAPATLDDLINWASRASTHAKTEPGHLVAFEGSGPDGPEFTTEEALRTGSTLECVGAPPARRSTLGNEGIEASSGERRALSAERSEPRIVVETYTFSQGDDGVHATVCLRRGSERLRTTATHPEDRLGAIALATVAALQSLLIPNARLALDDIRLVPAPTAEPGIVIALLTLSLPHDEERLLGAVHLQEDRYRSVINAVLDAVNRRLSLFCRRDRAPVAPDEVRMPTVE